VHFPKRVGENCWKKEHPRPRSLENDSGNGLADGGGRAELVGLGGAHEEGGRRCRPGNESVTPLCWGGGLRDFDVEQSGRETRGNGKEICPWVLWTRQALKRHSKKISALRIEGNFIRAGQGKGKKPEAKQAQDFSQPREGAEGMNLGEHLHTRGSRISAEKRGK